jgi:indole-3-glycerol phosphate synthase
MTADLLQTIVAAARRTAEARASRARRRQPVPARAPQGAAFEASLRCDGIRVIAECKRRSPSRGILRAEYDPAAIARGYAEAGAAAISVLTEPTFFSGSLDHLQAVRAAVDIPILRKDFIVSHYQVDEAVDAGADAVLLIVGGLARADLHALVAHARSAGLAALVEVHDRAELDIALGEGATIVGVNSRNLRTLDVDIALFDELAPMIPRGVVAVAESGLRSAADLVRLRSTRYDAFLIGERLMTTPDPGRALAEVLKAASTAGGGAQ